MVLISRGITEISSNPGPLIGRENIHTVLYTWTNNQY